MIIDSSALLAVVKVEPEEPAFLRAILLAPAAKMSVASYIECAMRLDGDLAEGRDERLDRVIAETGIVIVPVTVEQGQSARDAFNRFGKGRHPAKLNFGDCLSYALAATSGEPLLFKGNDFTQTDVLRWVET